MKKLIRLTTIPYSLTSLLKGQLKYMSKFYDVSAISSSSDGYLEKFGKEDGIKTIAVEMTRKITLFKDLSAAFKMFLVFRKEKPYIVHTHTPKAGTVGMLAAYLAGVPHRLHTIAGLPLVEVKGPKRVLLNFVEKITYHCATKIYPNSYGLQEIILENNFTSSSKLKVIGNGSSNGIDTSHYDSSLFDREKQNQIKKSLNIEEDDFVFIFVGRLVKDKGVNELIMAFDKFSKAYQNVKLLLVGPYERHLDPLEEVTENIIDQHPSIIKAGLQKDVRPYYAIAKALVFPSYREGFPNAVMEAGAMGLPAIVTNINGCNEIITNDENGIIVPTKSVSVLLNAMQELYQNESKYKNLATKARVMITSRFEREFIWKALLEEYQKL